MGTYTPNLNLYKPDASDPFGEFREKFNDNMDILDNGGGGGGSGGHTILDGDGNALPQEDDLQFTGNVSVTDDNVNGCTVVDIKGGNVYGAFLDPSRVIYSAFTFDNTEHSWTATEDVILTDDILPPSGSMAWYVRIDGKQVGAGYDLGNLFVYVKKGQVVTYRAKSGSTMKAYALIQGTNGIFAPVIYSDNERVIGVWRDNKPLYQKTFIATLNNIANDTATNIADISGLNIDEVADISGRCNYYNGANWFNVDFSTYYAVYAYPNGYLQFKQKMTNVTVDRVYKVAITLRYTKTTDVAGSGDYNTYGVPTEHYDASEQVIGTWTTGKPLYKKTVDIGTLPNNAQSQIAHNISNLGFVVDIKGTASNSSGTAMPLPYVHPTGLEYSVAVTVTTTTININTGRDRTAFSGYVTLVYTKTTD